METRHVLPSTEALTSVGKLVDFKVFSAMAVNRWGPTALAMTDPSDLSCTILVDGPIAPSF